MRILSRDPFARISYVRRLNTEADYPAGNECDWCGATTRATDHVGNSAPRIVRKLYQYGTLSDQRGAPSFDRHEFCSVSCARAWGVIP